MAQATPPLLLTKRLTAFLQASVSPTTPTLLLTTSSGKLLANASKQPVSTLRTQATVAASLFAIHTVSSVDVPSALPGASTPSDNGENDDTEDERENGGVLGSEDDSGGERDGRASRVKPTKPVTITVQLSGGIVVIRRLKCGLLFVCIGPPSDPDASNAVTPNHNASTPTAASTVSGAPASHPSQHGTHLTVNERNSSTVGSPSEESLISTGGMTNASVDSVNGAGAVTMRRHAAELSRWLDEKLGSLALPEEGVGIYH